MRTIFYLLFFFAVSNSSYSQLYLMPTAGTTSITCSGGTIYDDGGATEKYSANSKGILVLNPTNPTEKLELEFQDFDLRSTEYSYPYSYDYIKIYDGTSINAPLIGEFTDTPGFVVATNEAGALTIEFYSHQNPNQTKRGFEAIIHSTLRTNVVDLKIGATTKITQLYATTSSFYMTYSVVNLNSASQIVQNSKVKFYLSKDKEINTEDYLLFSQQLIVLAGNRPQRASNNIRIPNEVSSGEYYIIGKVDSDDEVSEANEANNLTVQKILLKRFNLDLVDISLTVSQIGYCGQPIYVSETIANAGEFATMPFKCKLYLSNNTEWDSSDILLSTANQSLSTNYSGSYGYTNFTYNSPVIPVNTAAGDYFIISVIDSENEIAEENENNNQQIKSITIRKHELIEIEAVSVTSDRITYGSNAAVQVVHNFTSTFSSNTVVKIGYYLSKTAVIDNTAILLSAKNITTTQNGVQKISDTVVLPSSLVDGNYVLWVKYDYLDEFHEVDENNNNTSVKIDIENSPLDLVVLNMRIEKNRASAPGNLSLKATFLNTGNENLGDVEVGFYLSSDATLNATDRFLKSYKLNVLQVGLNYNFEQWLSIPQTVELGSYQLIVKIDYLNKLQESDESNNVMARPVEIVENLPDLIALGAPNNLGEILNRNSISFNFFVQNIGVSYLFDGKVGFYLSQNNVFEPSDIFISAESFTNLAQGDSKLISQQIYVNSSWAEGEYYILAKVDYANEIVEVDETNNVVSSKFSLMQLTVDLLPIPSYAGKSKFSSGEFAKKIVRINNTGNSGSPYFETKLFLSKDVQFDQADILLKTLDIWSGVSAQNYQYIEFEFLIPTEILSGDYHLICQVDGNNELIETNKTNNVSAVGEIFVLNKNEILDNLPENQQFISITSCSKYLYCKEKTITNSNQNQNVELVIRPETNGSYAVLEFLSIQRGNETHMEIYDGENVSAPFLIQNIGTFQKVIATNPAGALTVVFKFNYTNSAQGADFGTFLAKISCVSSVSLAELNFFPHPNLLSVDKISIGGKVKTSLFLQNEGERIAKDSKVDLYLSKDEVIDNQDVLFTQISMPSIPNNNYHFFDYEFTIPEGTQVGDYFVLAVADSGGEVNESNESNNLLAMPLNIYRSYIDFALEQPYMQQRSSFEQTELISSSIEVKTTNYSLLPDDVNSLDLKVWLSTDNVIDASDIEVNSSVFEMNRIFSGNSQSIEFQIPSDTPFGSYYLIYKLDPLGKITELNELNNQKNVQISVVNPQKDIQVGGTTTTSAQISRTASFEIRTKIGGFNESRIPYPAIQTNYYLSRDKIVDNSDILLGSKMGAAGYGSSSENNLIFNCTVPATVVNGKYYILVLVDFENKLAETNEENNLSIAKIEIIDPVVDIIALNTSVLTRRVVQGEQLSVYSKIFNSGTNAVENLKLTYFLSSDENYSADDQMLYLENTISIAQESFYSENQSFTISTNVAPGNYYILTVCDRENQINEVNKLNNFSITPITIVANEPDLICSSFFISANSFETDQKVTLKYKIANIGNSKVNDFRVNLYLSKDNTWEESDLLVETKDISTILAFEELNYSSQLILPQLISVGSSYLIIRVDAQNAINESNEGNNVNACRWIVNPPSHDLSPTKLLLTSTTYLSGENYELSAVISNKGWHKVRESRAMVYLSSDNVIDNSDLLLNTLDVSGLAEESNKQILGNFALSSTILPGNYFIILSVDGDDEIVEVDESNNTIFKEIEIKERKSDLTFNTNLAFASNEIAKNQQLALTYTIKNIGNLESKPVKVSYFFSKDNVLSSDDELAEVNDLGSIAANQSLNMVKALVIPATLEIGSYFLIISVDKINELNELDETNNLLVKPIKIIENSSLALVDGQDDTEENIILFPNPAHTALTIQFQQDSQKLIELIQCLDASGKILFTESLGEQEQKSSSKNIDLSQVDSGVYFFHLHSKSGVLVRKVVVQK